ncbi:hypothetical protein F4780DRAFT_774204 [Xylariomycetidae sp. FL0641]|nr:hypothetical protein F4780DRAFT_774204 [Xylariomycetidae sp. FL0641]
MASLGGHHNSHQPPHLSKKTSIVGSGEVSVIQPTESASTKTEALEESTSTQPERRERNTSLTMHPAIATWDAPRFPSTVSAARVASFVSTAAWIQGTSADDVSLPPEALNNFLKRHASDERQRRRRRSAPEAEDGEEEGEGEEKRSAAGGEGDAEDDAASSSDNSSVSGSDSEEEGSGGSSAGGSEGGGDDDAKPTGPAQQNGVAFDASGRPVIESAAPAQLSDGAKAAIGIWTAVAVVGLAALVYFLLKRRRRRRGGAQGSTAANPARSSGSAPGDLETGSAAGPLAEKGAPPGMLAPAAAYLRPQSTRSDVQERSEAGDFYEQPQPPVGLRGGGGSSGGSGLGIYNNEYYNNDDAQSVAPSGQWVPGAPWQEEIPTWRASQPWRQSQPPPPPPPVPPIGLPTYPKPGVVVVGGGGGGRLPEDREDQLDRQTEYTAETESTIFAYR